MKLFTRIAATFSTTASDTVARFENHEAVGEAALEQSLRALSAARAVQRRRRRERDEQAMRIATAEREIDDWTRRAREHGDADEDTALACLARRQEIRNGLDGLRARLAERDAEGESFARRVAELEDRHDGLVSQVRRLSSRSAVARAESASARVVPDARLDGVLDRWEASVDVEEMRAGRASEDRTLPTIDAADLLETRLARAERDRALRAELDALREVAPRDGPVDAVDTIDAGAAR